MERKMQRDSVENVRPSPRKLKRERSKASSTLKWNNVHTEITRKSLSTPSMNIKDYDPVYALRKIGMLYEKNQNEEVARIISELLPATLLQIYKDFPMDLFIDSVPQSLVILDSLFSSLFLYNPDTFPSDNFDLNALVMNIVKLYVRGQSDDLPTLKNWDKIKRHCKNILKIIGYVKGTSVLKMLRHRRKCLHRAVESLGKHGLVEVEITPSNEENIVKKLLSLTDAVGVELERMIVNSKCAIHKLTTMDRIPIADGSSTLKRRQKAQHQPPPASAPSELSHQRMMALTSSDIQERLYQNKTLLNIAEPVMQYAQLPWLLTTLQERIERDKDILLTFSQLRKEISSVSPDAKLSQVLLQYSHALTTVIDLMKEYVKDDPDVHLSDEEKEFNPFVLESAHSKPASHVSGKSGTWSTGHSSSDKAEKPPGEKHATPDDAPNMERECSRMRKELHRARQAIDHLRRREKELLNKLSQQAENFISKSSNFENIEAGVQRSTELVRRYRNLYSEGRVQAFDAIDEILRKDGRRDDTGDQINGIKSKLLFSVIVLSFRSVGDTLDNIYIQLRKLLCMPYESAPKSASKDTELTIQSYLRKTGEAFDVTANFTDVFDRVCDALFECPELRSSSSLQSYVSECTRLAWLLSVQMPPFTIEYDATYFDATCHERFHTSLNDSAQITSFLWPSLLEKQSGKCISKGIVITG